MKKLVILLTMLLLGIMAFGQSKKEQIITLSGKIDSLKSENSKYFLLTSNLKNENKELSNSNSKLLQEKLKLISENDSLKKSNEKILNQELLSFHLNKKCQQSNYYEEDFDSQSLFNIKDCFKPSIAKTNYYKHFLISGLADSIISKDKDLGLSKKDLVGLIKNHLKKNDDIFNEIEINHNDNEIQNNDLIKFFLDLKMGMDLSVKKFNNNLFQVNTNFGNLSSNRFSIFYKYEENEQYKIYNIDSVLSEIEKKILLKTKINLRSMYTVFGANKINLNGKSYIVFQFAKDTDPACCPSFSVAILHKASFYDFLSFDDVFISENGKTNKWSKLN